MLKHFIQYSPRCNGRTVCNFNRYKIRHNENMPATTLSCQEK